VSILHAELGTLYATVAGALASSVVSALFGPDDRGTERRAVADPVSEPDDAARGRAHADADVRPFDGPEYDPVDRVAELSAQQLRPVVGPLGRPVVDEPERLSDGFAVSGAERDSVVRSLDFADVESDERFADL